MTTRSTPKTRVGWTEFNSALRGETAAIYL